LARNDEPFLGFAFIVYWLRCTFCFHITGGQNHYLLAKSHNLRVEVSFYETCSAMFSSAAMSLGCHAFTTLQSLASCDKRAKFLLEQMRWQSHCASLSNIIRSAQPTTVYVGGNKPRGIPKIITKSLEVLCMMLSTFIAFAIQLFASIVPALVLALSVSRRQKGFVCIKLAMHSGVDMVSSSSKALTGHCHLTNLSHLPHLRKLSICQATSLSAGLFWTRSYVR